MPESSFVDMGHRRIRSAAERVQTTSELKRLGKHIAGLPVLVRTLGVAQAVALLSSRSETAPVAEAIIQWLMKDCPSHPFGKGEEPGVGAFLRAFARLDQAAAHAIDEEGLRFVEALKLFSSAFHKDGAEVGNGKAGGAT